MHSGKAHEKCLHGKGSEAVTAEIRFRLRPGIQHIQIKIHSPLMHTRLDLIQEHAPAPTELRRGPQVVEAGSGIDDSVQDVGKVPPMELRIPILSQPVSDSPPGRLVSWG